MCFDNFSIPTIRGVHGSVKPTKPTRTDHFSTEPTRIFLTRYVFGLKKYKPDLIGLVTGLNIFRPNQTNPNKK